MFDLIAEMWDVIVSTFSSKQAEKYKKEAEECKKKISTMSD
ncbi:hypothetical protein SAMN06265361_103298 [Laceyella tengchongensis]|jgi:hypothetical protein|uniref:Uncharacterized protein n=1 Tax=Laceyella tengchongensis TaxID=574699 RepID=A0AA45WP25_9BACL|nr:hypothetical protein [Laceyella tengchongensis]SMP19672.1 hypothetical protein SAMN06265361_103298 [Laceyella tengchongensis]